MPDANTKSPLDYISGLMPGRGLSQPPSPDVLRARLAKAELKVAAARADHNAAALTMEAGGDAGYEKAAMDRLLKAKAEHNRIEAALMYAVQLEVQAAKDAQKAKEDAEDAKALKDIEALAKAAKALEQALQPAVQAYDALVAAGDRAQAHVLNRRIRSGLMTQPVRRLVSTELARICAGSKAPMPGPDMAAVALGGLSKLPTLSEHFAGIAAAVKEGFNHDRHVSV